MMLCLRWFGPEDPVPLAHIRQVPVVQGIVTSLHHQRPGALWPEDALARLRDAVEAAGLALAVIESLPVHETIKLGRDGRDALIETYQRNLERIAGCGATVVCYNFMPLFDWYRTDLAFSLPDGSSTLRYDHAATQIPAVPFSEYLPAWMPVEDPPALLAAYRALPAEALWDNLAYFLERVSPVAAAAGLKLALHPDDPPWPIFGLPRIITDAPALARVLALADTPANGLAFCTGSLGARAGNDLPAMIRQFGPRIHFVHARNVRWTGPQSFYESAHPTAHGDVPMAGVIRTLHSIGYAGPIRPDHGRSLWGEAGRPGYGLYDRALGAMYLAGLWEATASDR